MVNYGCGLGMENEMTFRDPDWLPTPAPHTGPDALDDDTCQHCDGTGDDPDVAEGRGIFIMCPECGGTGVEQ